MVNHKKQEYYPKRNGDWLDKNVFMSKILKLCHRENLKVYMTLRIACKRHHYHVWEPQQWVSRIALGLLWETARVMTICNSMPVVAEEDMIFA